ncbi:hypothetical protein LAZ67_7002665 [Cordylochernes scorpioides]|uniref:Retrovirus-related Pol polyprotein from transposon TNT 1-94-like beta-barrel domain-containing protein n=1 Tax=Cordylochernes scorpioides TaxID=51811 RepID=A0ABY6KP97_9ARAC|nr:hypothetical protein LAZ67_7002665 [Cordylochernes scorpioides]
MVCSRVEEIAPISRPQQGVMVWGAISFDSRTPLVVIPGTLTAQRTYDGEIYCIPEGQPTTSWMVTFSPYYLLPKMADDAPRTKAEEDAQLETYDGEIYCIPEGQPTTSWMVTFSPYYLLPYTDMVMVFRKIADDAPWTKAEEDAQLDFQNVEETEKFVKESTELLSTACFNLRDWVKGIGQGEIKVITPQGKTDTLLLTKVLYIPELTDNLLSDLELEQKAPIYFHQDNQSCLKICSSEKVSSRTKHIATKIHHLKDLQKKTVIKMVYCPTGDMKADILTKPLPRPTFEKLRYNLVMSPHSCRGFVG